MQKRFKIVLFLMVVSLFGLILIQGLWIKYAVETEKARFDNLVYGAMKSALLKVERHNVFEFIDDRIDRSVEKILKEIKKNIYSKQEV